MRLFNFLFDPLKDAKRLVAEVNDLEKSVTGLTAEQLAEQSEKLRHRARTGEALDRLLPEAFALIREAAKRTLSQRHFDVQLIGGVILHQGKIAEMSTGEGKTL